jgi:pimeloyl-ACP methyl ester carboxylesterase
MTHASSICERLALGEMTLNVRHWGVPGAPALFMLHGWMDCSITFQFVADRLARSFHIIAPDLRGYGQSTWLGRPYAFVEHYADLDALLSHYSPHHPVMLAGHSMGANIACNYAAARPERVERLALMDFLGRTPEPGVDASDQLRTWLMARAGVPAARSYPDVDAFAARLRKANPRLDESRARFLACHLTVPLDDGRMAMACDPWHRLPAPCVYHLEDWLSTWCKLRSPVLLLVADEGEVRAQLGTSDPEYLRRLACFERVSVVEVLGSGHNIQHDGPERVATELKAFFSDSPMLNPY